METAPDSPPADTDQTQREQHEAASREQEVTAKDHAAVQAWVRSSQEFAHSQALAKADAEAAAIFASVARAPTSARHPTGAPELPAASTAAVSPTTPEAPPQAADPAEEGTSDPGEVILDVGQFLLDEDWWRDPDEASPPSPTGAASSTSPAPPPAEPAEADRFFYDRMLIEAARRLSTAQRDLLCTWHQHQILRTDAATARKDVAIAARLVAQYGVPAWLERESAAADAEMSQRALSHRHVRRQLRTVSDRVSAVAESAAQVIRNRVIRSAEGQRSRSAPPAPPPGPAEDPDPVYVPAHRQHQ